MRLLNTATLDIKEFMADDDRPPYAILSHTWGEEEVSWAQWQSRLESPTDVEETLGGAKIAACCRQAAADGFGWAWVDTCCIDKSSSAELSEAINSMFQWYRDADICYVYLADVLNAPWLSSQARDSVSKSRWFTRGWTLQELLAPRKLIFYSQDWQPLGNNTYFAEMISSVTRIGRRFLDGELSLELASIAQKMSWAAHRQTTRLEDQAYSLLGIFDINIPLLYGEGSKAFQRLQETLLTMYPEDHSLLAWGPIVDTFPWTASDVCGSKSPVPWIPPNADTELCGLLAASPADFAGSCNIVAYRTAAEVFYHRPDLSASLPSLAGRGAVKIQLPSYVKGTVTYSWSDPPIAQLRQAQAGMLLCNYDGLDEALGAFFITLVPTGAAKFSRKRNLVYVPNQHIALAFDYWTETREAETVAREPSFAFCPGDIVFRRYVCYSEAPFAFLCCKAPPQLGLAFLDGTGLLRAGTHLGGLCDMCYDVKIPGGKQQLERSFAVRVARVASPGAGKTCLKFTLIPYHADDSISSRVKEVIDGFYVTWNHYSLTRASDSPVVLGDSGHLMRASGYSWTLAVKPFPTFFINVERIPLAAGGFIDAVDIVIDPIDADGPSADTT
ncbi:Vegetative incompatibility protein HET-E-1 [Madurella mycetomatis]|uniref:Vegetative incompatibility protein HET-E-1 n=1 Tax=Madurella mycetomatis TaxID=100816 RepID=A0A175VTS5_9PEZI|nr:Vegetative incompatibility protein HET-E-1 [Madurella mycetomatis]